MNKFSKSVMLVVPFILISCGGGGGGGGESDPSYPVAPPSTVSLSSSASDVLINETVTLTWSSTNATSCSASGSWTGDLATNGNQSVQIIGFGSNTFNINCSGATASTSVTSTINFEVNTVEQTDDYGIVELSISGYALADDQQEEMTVIQTSGTDILWLTKDSSSKYSFRAPVINATEEIILDVSLSFSGISETETKEIKINVTPLRNTLLGLSLSEFPGGSQNDGWPTFNTDYYKTWNS
jgi:hypothetical protein